MGSGLHRPLERWLWLAAYVVLLLCPLALLLAVPPRGADRLTLFGIAIGFVTLSTIVLQFLTPSRAPQFTSTFGIGPLLRLHRLMGYGVLLLLAIHIGVFVVHDPKQFVSWLLPIHGPFKAQAGWVAAVALVAIAATSTWRRKLRLSYEHWRLVHILLGIALVVGGATHALLVSWYSAIDALRGYIVIGMAVGLVALLYLRIGRPFAALGQPYLLVGVDRERGDAVTLRLEAQGHAGVPFLPGQFAWLRLNGRAFALTEHPFSYASSSSDPARPTFTIKQLGDFTSRAHELQPGSMIFLDGPHGAYEPVLPDAGFVLVVGGIGITPAMSIIRTCADLQDPRPVQLIYGARTWEDITFREEIEALHQRGALEVIYVLSNPEPGWTGRTGFVNGEVLAQVLPADAVHRNFVVCGPPVMIDGVLKSLHELQIPPALVYADRFDSV
ncbi:MAG: ferric reductase-like transmembrane domain-containing protein [Thermoleophilia bacterium]|nr:ferric reductase-like transmembrane domain-containing protein [Thermoleophilia bacterium]